MEPRGHRCILSWALSGALLLTSVATGSAATPGLLTSQAQKDQKQKKTTSKTAPAAGCINVSWLNLPNVPAFVMDVPATPTNCDFHELVYQNFFALNLGSNPAIASWPTSQQAYPASGTPTCTGAPLASSLRTKLAKHVPTAARAAATITDLSSLDDDLQATGQALVDQNGRYVQYEIRVNPQLCQTITSCQLYTTGCVSAALAASNPQFLFPVGNGTTVPGVAEVKIAWRVMETCNLPDSPKSNCKKDDLSQFVTVPNVSVQPYSPTNQGAVTVTVGMVGFHLAQKTPNRPEFIWGTWEHKASDPVCPGSSNPACLDPSKASSGISTASGWSFTNPPVSICTGSQTGPQCANVVQPNSTATQTATNVCRVFPCGGGSEPNNENQINISSLNAAVLAKVKGTVWANYFLGGTLWGGGATVQGDPSVPNTGSVLLANTTMETYFQAQGQNCFTCHNYAPSVQFQNLDFVHSIVRAQQKTTSCPVNINTCAGSASTTAMTLLQSSKK
ncbi:MAG TPA: hypothetical protein VHU81_12870 [Thermoanaerobaculia bacterium]|nr:hypothetical protein [Thermoanaerobaculia bacterium]